MIPAIGQTDSMLGSLCGYRLFGLPMVMTWLGAGRLLARFKPAKRLLSWALAIEAMTLALMVALLFFSGRASRG
jgi:hypothetical protein